MLLNKIKLKNIRSIESLDLSFEEGITLLTGDIGSGKTTILMAIEFALFGILRGKVTPNEILRHGETEGYVNLQFTIEDKKISITRFLKRTSSGINQPPGTIIINGQEEELVATELKSKILEILGYPQSLLKKSTSLFRFTVYTPQEQVKLILHESEEERKDIIRKIFSLDKYKNIVSNISPYQTFLRSQIETNEGRLYDLTTLKEQKTAKENEIEHLKKNIIIKEQQQTKSLEQKNKSRQKLDDLEKLNKEFLEHKQKIKLKQQNISNIKNNFKSLLERENKLNDSLKKTTIKEIKFDKDIKIKLEEKLKLYNEKQIKVSKQEGSLFANQKQISNISNSIISLDECPTCRQKVSDSHKHKIKDLQTKSSEKLQKQIKELDLYKEKLNQKINETKQKLEDQIILEKEFLKYQEIKKSQDLIQSEIKNIQSEIKKYEEKIKIEEQSLKELLNENKKEIPIEKEKKDYEEKSQMLKNIELELNTLTTRQNIATKTLKDLNEAIKIKIELQKTNHKLKSIKTWINDLFIPLLNTIERKVMLKVYAEFNLLFIKWFEILIDNQPINVHLDENFTPIIEQNGYITGIENLSGGEKTSLALSYRLALNKVLNDYFSRINTKDLLILDEPTDGFSTEQLDKLAQVLNNLDAKQIILVSHEQKMESFAQNVIRVEKNTHRTEICK